MNNVVGTSQSSKSLRAQQAMCIRNDADDH
jgi:hypothetical protein